MILRRLIEHVKTRNWTIPHGKGKPMKFVRTMTALTAFNLMTACSGMHGAAPATHDPVTQDPPAVDAGYPPAIVETNFQSHGARLNALIYLANGAGPHPTVILLHGYPGNEKNLDLAQALRRDGFNVLFFHYRGAWGSEGEFSFTHVIEDVASAADFLRAQAKTFRVDADHLILIGHSMGGFAALQGAARDGAIACVAGITPGDVGAFPALFEENSDIEQTFVAYSDDLQMLSGWSGEKFLAELRANVEAFSLVGLAPKLAGKSVLIVAAEEDEVVPAKTVVAPIADAYASAPGVDLTSIVLSGDHSFSWSRIALIRTVLNWVDGCRGE